MTTLWASTVCYRDRFPFTFTARSGFALFVISCSIMFCRLRWLSYLRAESNIFKSVALYDTGMIESVYLLFEIRQCERCLKMKHLNSYAQ
jgi:hypothetical protein